MKKQILVAAIIACASIHSARAQGGGTWTPLITQANGGWANLTGTEPYPAGVRPARAIHMVHLRPTNPAMGNTGRFVILGT